MSRWTTTRKYYIGMAIVTLTMAVVAAVLVVFHGRGVELSPRAFKVMGFGSIFWAVIAYGYWSDMRQRDREDGEDSRENAA